MFGVVASRFSHFQFPEWVLVVIVNCWRVSAQQRIAQYYFHCRESIQPFPVLRVSIGCDRDLLKGECTAKNCAVLFPLSRVHSVISSEESKYWGWSWVDSVISGSQSEYWMWSWIVERWEHSKELCSIIPIVASPFSHFQCWEWVLDVIVNCWRVRAQKRIAQYYSHCRESIQSFPMKRVNIGGGHE